MMEMAPLLSDESARQRHVTRLAILDTPPEREFDDITILASAICGTSVAVLSLTDRDRLWFKSRVGLDMSEVPRDLSLCRHALEGDGLFEVPDATADPRYSDSPMVTGERPMRFYAGVPLGVADGQKVGVLCVMDERPRELTEAQREALQVLGRQVERLFEVRQRLRLHREIFAEAEMNRAIIESAGVGIVTVSRHGTITSFNRAAESILGYAAADLVGKERVSILLEASRLQKEAEEMSRHYGEEVKGMGVFLRPLRDEPSYTREWKFRAKDGAPVTVSLTLSILRDEEGRESGYLAVMRDLTATRLREREAKNLIRAADIVQQTQEDFITGVARDSLFSRLLGRILSFTRGEFGFIGEVLRDAQGMPYLKTHSISNIAWDEESRTLYEENRATGFEFHNMETLFGLVMTSGEMVISNDPANDPRRGGVPPGHPAMHSFLGLPLYYGGQIVGMLGLANRPGGFNEGVVRKVQPLASSCALLIQAVRLENERLEAQRALEQQEKRLRLIIETEADCFVEVGADGLVKEWNLYAERQLQVPRHEALGRPIDAIVTFQEADGRPTSLTDYDTGTHESRESSREVTAVRRDGSVFPAELVTWALATDDSRSFCAFIRDIGPRKELELQQRMRFQSETLLKEVHHRIKNNMQVISSLLSIQSSKLADEEQRQVFLECRERIRAMSLIHDRLYSTGDYEHIDFGDYLRQMVSLITSSNCPSGTSVKLDVEVQSVVVAVEDAVPLSLIAAELVLNSLKHGFRGRTEGVMTVRLRQTDGLCDLFIGDDGPGLPGEAPDGGAGSGLQLIDALTRQIRGTREHGAAGTSIRWKA